MNLYQNLFTKISLFERRIAANREKIAGAGTRAPWRFNAASGLDNLTLAFYRLLLALTRAWMIIRGAPASNFNVFTQAGKEGVYICNYSYCYYKDFHNKTKYKFLTMVTVATIVVSLIVALVFPGKPVSRAATNNWNQTDWSLGADIAALANHIANQTGWQKFYSKDANVIVGYSADGGTAGEAKLAATTSGVTETTTADFNAGTKSNTGASNNSVVLLKPVGGSCSVDNECIIGSYCSGSVCGTPVSFVTIGTQQWMASNVNVGTRISGSATPANNGIVEKYCYSDTEANCTTDGGLYQWNEAMGYAATCNGTGASQPACTTPVQGICPSGTHLPSHYEWTLLEKNVGSNPDAFPYDTTTTGWLGANEGTNLKSSGTPHFYGILAGYRNTDGKFLNRGTYAYFWSSSESGTAARDRVLSSGYATVLRDTGGKDYGFSVRCLKD